MSLDANVNKLIRDHPHRYDASYKDGRQTRVETEWLTRPPLIGHLRASVGVANDRASGGSGGKPSPLNMPAYSLYEDISRRAEGLCSHIIGRPVTRKLTLEQQIEAWAFHVQEHDVEKVPYGVELTSGWVDAINALFQPVRKTEIVGACPSCSQRWLMVEGDGELKRIPTLQAVGATVACQQCGTEWTGMQLHFLKLALDTAEETAVKSGESVAE